MTSGGLCGVMVSVEVCTDLSDKEPHIYLGEDKGGDIRGSMWCNG